MSSIVLLAQALPSASSGVDWLYQFTNNLTNLTTQNGGALTQLGMTELACISFFMLVSMVVNNFSVSVGMAMNYPLCVLPNSSDRARRTKKTHNIHRAQHNQHESHGKLHRQSDSRRNYDIEKNDQRTDCENGEGMPDAPENSRERCLEEIALPAHDRRHRDHVVRVGGVTHPQKKSHRDNR